MWPVAQAFSPALSDVVGAAGAVTGIDISEDMLGLTRKLTNGQFLTIEWRECDAQCLPFEDAIFVVAFFPAWIDVNSDLCFAGQRSIMMELFRGLGTSRFKRRHLCHIRIIKGSAFTTKL